MWLKSLTNLMKICESVRSHNMPLSFIDQRAVHCADFFPRRCASPSNVRLRPRQCRFQPSGVVGYALFC